MNMNTLKLIIASNVILSNISFNSDTTVIIEAGRSLNIVGTLNLVSGSTLNISGEGTLGSNIISKGIIENINNGQSVIHKGITSEILLNIALNLNFMEENTDSNSDTTILGNTDPEI